MISGRGSAMNAGSMRLHRTEVRIRWRGGGHLNWHQRHRLNRMENRDSGAIHRLKHNYRHD
jgi:hypothetical protein